MFAGKGAEHEQSQIHLARDKYTAPLLQDFPNTFAMIHQIGLGCYPENFFNKLDEVSLRHHRQKEDLILGRVLDWTQHLT